MEPSPIGSLLASIGVVGVVLLVTFSVILFVLTLLLPLAVARIWHWTYRAAQDLETIRKIMLDQNK